MKRLWISIITVALACGVALGEPADKVAEEHFRHGNTAYNLARFDEAVEHFTRAYEAWPQPEFLYNIAQSYRLGGNCKQALHFYKRFRSLEDRDPASPLTPKKREEIARFITQLTECAAKAERSATAQPDSIDRPEPAAAPATTAPPPTPPDETMGDEDEEVAAPPPSRRGLKIAGVATAGVGLALVLTGGAFGVQARSAQADLEAAVKNGDPFDPDRDAAGRRNETISVVTLGVGAAAVVAGGVMYFLAARRGAPPARTAARMRIVPSVGARSAGLTLDVRY